MAQIMLSTNAELSFMWLKVNCQIKFVLARANNSPIFSLHFTIHFQLHNVCNSLAHFPSLSVFKNYCNEFMNAVRLVFICSLICRLHYCYVIEYSII